MKPEEILKYLLLNKNHRADALELDNTSVFQIGIWQHPVYLFLVCTASRNGKAIRGSKGLILSKDKTLEWLRNCKAKVTV